MGVRQHLLGRVKLMSNSVTGVDVASKFSFRLHIGDVKYTLSLVLVKTLYICQACYLCCELLLVLLHMVSIQVEEPKRHGEHQVQFE
jgi:hypothetical protein